MQPKKFVQRQATERSTTNSGTPPAIDKTRATAALVRQSKDGADTAQAESRETQLGLQDYGEWLYGDDTPNVRLYDEGAGVSGQKRIDQRKELDRLYQDMHKGIIGTILVTREDRLFRNKHMDQVGVFTKLAEEKKIIVIVPPLVSDEIRLYDFCNYEHLREFEEKMRAAYDFIYYQNGYQQYCKQSKADKGGYDGRPLPPGFAVKGRKQDQKLVIYEPWAKKLKKLALRAQALDWDMGKLNREVAKMVSLFPEIPDEDKERYIFKTNMHHIPGVGYKPRGPQTIRAWLTNEMYIGWWQPDDEKPDTITNNHPAILDYDLFAEGYAQLTGFTLDGEPADNPRSVTRIRKTRDGVPDALFHSRLIATPPSADRTAFTSVDGPESRLCYLGISTRKEGIIKDKLFSIPVAAFDEVAIQRLKTLVEVDEKVKDKVKSTLEQMQEQQGEDFVSIHEQLKGLEIQLAENAEKRLETSKKDPLYAKSQKQAEELLQIQEELEKKKIKLGIIDDDPEEIRRLHRLLGNFDAVWPTFRIDQKQRAFSLLVNRIEVEVVSPHWFRLSIDWLDALCPHVDIASLWKAVPTRGEGLNDQEKEIIKQHYPCSSQLELLKLLPDKTWIMIQQYASSNNINRTTRSPRDVPSHVCYRDFMPKLDGNYLFRDYETTHDYITKASSQTHKSEAPFYAIWIPSKDEDRKHAVEWHLSGMASAKQR